MTQSEITIEPMTAAHVAEALALSVQARWPHRREDWEILLGISNGWVALDAGNVVGTAIMTPFGTTGGAINMVIVSETMRGRGIGRRLFAATLDAAHGRRLRLTATPDGEPLYRSLGFEPYGRIFQRQGTLGAVPDMPGAEDATDADDAGILALDKAAFGEDRSALLHALKQVGRFAVVRRDGAVAAFACIRAFGRGTLVGPIVAVDTQDAQRLISHLAAGQEGTFVRLDIASDTGLNDWLTGIGLPQTDDGLVMWTERPTVPAAVPRGRWPWRARPWVEPAMLNPELAKLPTPALILDESRMLRNVHRLRDRLGPLGVSIRPHLKTVKSVDAARRILDNGNGPATVSTLKEAEMFAAAGVNDILYAVGIAPDKLDRVCAIRAGGCDLSVTLDTAEQAEAVVQAAKAAGMAIPTLIEIDCDNHRAGLNPRSPALARIGRILADASCLAGVMTHAGESYKAVGAEAQAACAEVERAAVVVAAETLAMAGLACPVRSVGATPTAHFARDLTGVTEVRAGVYVLFDLVMAGTGTCAIDDIALSVVTTVIGHQPEQGWIMIDAGWMALSRDRGTAVQAVDQGYGLVCDVDGTVLDDLFVLSANQEHGIVASRGRVAPELPIGTRLRILPNHACATGSQHDGYHVIPDGEPGALAYWPRFRGW